MRGYSIFDGTIADMTWVEVEQAAENGAIMLVPIGVIEQHGPHLPLGTDMYAGYLMCFLMKNELDRLGIATVVAPPYYFGMNETTGMFPGLITIRRESMIAVLSDIFVSYKKSGFSKQFILNHHGDPQHNDAIIQAILSAREADVDAVYVMGGFVQHFIEEAYTTAFKKALPLPPSAIIKAEESDRTATKHDTNANFFIFASFLNCACYDLHPRIGTSLFIFLNLGLTPSFLGLLKIEFPILITLTKIMRRPPQWYYKVPFS